MKIPEQTWDKVAAQALALLTAVLYMGNTVLGWQLTDAKTTAIIGVASAFLTLVLIVLYANNSTPDAAVKDYIEGAWKMGKREASGALVEGAPYRVGAIKGVAPTRAQVRHFVEFDTRSREDA